MFAKTGHIEAPLDLMATSTSAPQAITLHDFMELTSHLARETPIFALVIDDDEVEYTRQVVSAAIRVERNKGIASSTCIELRVQPDN